MTSTSRTLLISLVLLVAGTAASQPAEWLADVHLNVLTPEVALLEDAVVEVSNPPGLDFDLTLDWGDGVTDTVDRFGAAVQTFTHAYATRGVKLLEVYQYDSFADVRWHADSGVILVGSTAELSVFPTIADVGETVTAEVTSGEEGGRIDWGDGAFDLLAGGAEELQHTYQSAGVYVVQLRSASGAVQASATVSVTATPLTFDLPDSAVVGEDLVAVIEGLAGNAPQGAMITWGDGSLDALTGDGATPHTYLRPGVYAVRLETLPSQTLLAASDVSVTATGALDLPAEAVLFEATVISAVDLAPGLAYEVAFGDGASEVAFADLGGELSISHEYLAPQLRFDVTLQLVEGGQRTQLDFGRLDSALPAPLETLAIAGAARPADSTFDVSAVAEGLLPGVSYVITSPQLGQLPVVKSSQTSGAADFETQVEGEVELTLEALLSVAGGGWVSVPRTVATYTTAWPRGSEALTIQADLWPVLNTDVVTVVAAGLVSGYGYDLVINDRTDAPYRLSPAEVAALEEPGTWRVEVPIEVFGPDVTFDLYARLPALGQPLGAAELRASLALNATVPGGSLALPDPVVPYLVPSPVFVRDLTPGLPYRVEFPNDRIERFTAPESGELDFEYAFGDASGDVELYADRPGADLQPVATIAPGGITFVGRLGYTYDVATYLETGEVTILVRGVAPGFEYTVRFGEVLAGTGTADENGRLDLSVIEPTQEVQLYMHVFDQETFVTQSRIDDLPPRELSFHGFDGWKVRVTNLEVGESEPVEGEEMPRPPVSRDDLTGTGILENFVAGGRLQESVPVTFEHVGAFYGGTVRVGNARLVEPLELALPQAVRGTAVTLTELTLGPASERPVIRGTATLPNGSSGSFDSVLQPRGAPGEGFIAMLSGIAPTPIGTTGWSFAPGPRFGAAVLDLSTQTDYNFVGESGESALVEAYSAYQEVGRTPPLDAVGGWVGLLYPNAELRMPAGGDSYTAFETHIAWTSGGTTANASVPLGQDGKLHIGGWDFTDVTGLELVVVDDQIVSFTPPSGTVRLAWFGKDVPVSFSPNATAVGGWAVRTLAPVATDYGSTAVVGGVGTFLRSTNNTIVLRFSNALWALDGDLASDPATIDTSAGDALIASLPQLGETTDELAQSYEDAVATSETVLNLYRLQLLLKDLTLYGDGSVDLNHTQWRTLAKVPALDMFGFPYLGAGAEIGVRREGGKYAIGLRGELKLGDVVQANAAPSWYVHSDGTEERWEFEGVGVKYGDYEDSPVQFSVVVGGVIDLQRLALSFTGAGSLTVGEKLSVEALALFGVMEQDGPLPDFFWFVSAGVDLANMNRPINVSVQGVDVLAFYAFRGGIASKLRIDVGGGDCRVDDGNVPELVLPSIATNALECYDPDLPVSFLGGTVIGSPVQGGAGSAAYGIIWHLDANLVVNLGKGGDLQIAGQGWIGKNLDDGYRQRGIEQPQLAGRVVINKDGIVGSMCAGPTTATSSVLDCSGLAEAKIAVGGLTLVEMKGAMGLSASWSTGEYFLALGTVGSPVHMYVIPSFSQGYFILGYIKSPGILASNVGLPAGGLWVGAQRGFAWDYSDSGRVWPCDWSVYANARFGFGGAFGLQVAPSFAFDAAITAYASAAAGGRVCGKGLDVSASLTATGRFRAPNPTEFRGDFSVKVNLPVIPDIDVTVRNIGVSIN